MSAAHLAALADSSISQKKDTEIFVHDGITGTRTDTCTNLEWKCFHGGTKHRRGTQRSSDDCHPMMHPGTPTRQAIEYQLEFVPYSKSIYMRLSSLISQVCETLSSTKRVNSDVQRHSGLAERQTCPNNVCLSVCRFMAHVPTHAIWSNCVRIMDDWCSRDRCKYLQLLLAGQEGVSPLGYYESHIEFL